MTETKEQKKLRLDMRKAGYPYCYRENGKPKHCSTCIEVYEKMLKL